MYVCVRAYACVCVEERVNKRGRDRDLQSSLDHAKVGERARERERGRKRERDLQTSLEHVSRSDNV